LFCGCVSLGLAGFGGSWRDHASRPWLGGGGGGGGVTCIAGAWAARGWLWSVRGRGWDGPLRWLGHFPQRKLPPGEEAVQDIVEPDLAMGVSVAGAYGVISAGVGKEPGGVAAFLKS
jgi:hypothetical protein